MRPVFLVVALFVGCAGPVAETLNPVHADAYGRCPATTHEDAASPLDGTGNPADGGDYIREFAPRAAPCKPLADCSFVRSL
ncbi:hypothetical protein BH11MYX4_BH11MYX4_29640 [soil metagenome]